MTTKKILLVIAALFTLTSVFAGSLTYNCRIINNTEQNFWVNFKACLGVVNSLTLYQPSISGASDHSVKSFLAKANSTTNDTTFKWNRHSKKGESVPFNTRVVWYGLPSLMVKFENIGYFMYSPKSGHQSERSYIIQQESSLKSFVIPYTENHYQAYIAYYSKSGKKSGGKISDGGTVEITIKNKEI